MSYSLAPRLERAVKNAGVSYKKVSGWASRGHGSMGTIRGVVAHHTAGPKSGNTPSLNVVTHGRPGLSGPLAQLFLARDGTVYLVAAGVAWHAGRVNDSNFTNSHAIGIEAENTGLSNDPWPAHQIDAYAKLCKALCREFGLSTSRVRGHKEICSPRGRKIDPTFNCDQFRAKVGGASGGVSSGGGSTGGGSYESATAKHAVGSRVMGLYDGGTDVRWLQKRLYKLGWNNDMDGLFGPNTQKIVKALQRDSGLKQDGLAGPDTISAAKAAKVVRNLPEKPKHAEPDFPLPKGHWYGTESPNPRNHSGYWSKDRAGVKQVQRKLGVAADGLFGPKTEAAVKSLQRRAKIAVDGCVGEVTWRKLM